MVTLAGIIVVWLQLVESLAWRRHRYQGRHRVEKASGRECYNCCATGVQMLRLRSQNGACL